MSLIEWIILNRAMIFGSLAGEKPTQTWFDGLTIPVKTTWASFRQTYTRILPALEALIEQDKIIAELKATQQDTQPSTKGGDTQQDTQKNDTQDTQSGYPKISGWKVQKSPDGYFRAHKRVKGKMRSVYIGKNPELAESKIMAKEKALK